MRLLRCANFLKVIFFTWKNDTHSKYFYLIVVHAEEKIKSLLYVFVSSQLDNFGEV